MVILSFASLCFFAKLPENLSKDWQGKGWKEVFPFKSSNFVDGCYPLDDGQFQNWHTCLWKTPLAGIFQKPKAHLSRQTKKLRLSQAVYTQGGWLGSCVKFPRLGLSKHKTGNYESLGICLAKAALIYSEWCPKQGTARGYGNTLTCIAGMVFSWTRELVHWTRLDKHHSWHFLAVNFGGYTVL